MKIVNRNLCAGLLLAIMSSTAWAGSPALAAKWYHSMVLKSDGSVWEWGISGAIGNNTLTQAVLKVPATAIVAFPNSSLVFGSDTNLYAWGDNFQYELGLANQNGYSSPTLIVGGAPLSITSNGATTVEALANGTVYSWGLNLYGERGQGPILLSTTPNPSAWGQVPSLSNITAVSSGELHTLALRSDGTVWAWGVNTSGQLGDGTTTTRENPAQIAGLSNVTAIAAGGSYSIAIKSDGTVWTWGSDSGAQSTTPSQLSGLTTAKAVAMNGAFGFSHSLILKTDGTVWAWGSNQNGEVGDGTTTPRSIPVQVLSGVVSIAAGAYHSLAIKSDGSVWAWGSGNNLPFGSANAFPTPTKIQQFYAIPPLPPVNDNFVNRTTISGTSGSIAGTLAGATHEAGEPYEGGYPSNSIWYKWVAPSTGQVTLSAVGGPNTYTAAYTGSAVNALTQASVGNVFYANKGTEYEIVVYDTANALYDTTLNWSLNTSASANLSVTGSGGMSATPGLAFYSLTVSNAGPNIATNIVLTDTLPSGATFVPNVNSPNCSLSGNQVICSIASIAPGASTSILIELQFSNTQTVPSNSFSVSTVVPDPNPASETVSIVASPYVAPTVDNDVPTLPEWGTILMGFGLLFAMYRRSRGTNMS